VKTNIGCRLMPGTYVGFCCALLGGDIPPRFIPSFSFWTDKGMAPFDIDKAKQIMKAVYARRDLNWTDADDRMVAQVLNTAPQVENPVPAGASRHPAADQALLGPPKQSSHFVQDFFHDFASAAATNHPRSR
jgi:hypothetical protein